MTEPLFAGYDPPPQPHKDPALSAGRRLTLRQAADILAERHPLTRGPLHPDADRGATRDDGPKRPFTCGTCVHRELFLWHNTTYPKCVAHNRAYMTHCQTTDVRAWWPACPQYQAEGATE